MRPLALALIIAALVSPAVARPRQPMAPGEQTCVDRRQVRDIEPAPGGQLLFRMNGRTDYLNKQDVACEYNPNFQIIINRDFSGGSQYCELDLLKLQDRTSGIYGGTCALGTFTPVPKPERARHP